MLQPPSGLRLRPRSYCTRSSAVTFSRGNGTYVVNGVVRSEEPRLPGEVCVENEFPCNYKRSLRLKKWLVGQLTADPYVGSGASISADRETVTEVGANVLCETCAFAFKNREHLEFHSKERFCNSAPTADVAQRQFQRESVGCITFRVQGQYLMQDGNPIPGSPIRVCWCRVPIFVMYASEWMWCREEIAAIRAGLAFHRCYRVAELPFVVFDARSPWVPQLSACLEDVWSLPDVLTLLEPLNNSADPALALTEQIDVLRRSALACVVAGPHVGLSDRCLHISILTLTSEGTAEKRIYVHPSRLTLDFCTTYIPNRPIVESLSRQSQRSEGVVAVGTAPRAFVS